MLDDDATEIYAILGNRVRQTRTARGITLDQLAALTGFTTSYLSKIENRRKVPPIATLARIARALEVDIAYFFEGERAGNDESVSVVRAGERQPVMRGGTSFGYDYEGLAHTKRNKHMEPFIFTFPTSISKDVSFEHEGEEFVFVLSGERRVRSGKPDLGAPGRRQPLHGFVDPTSRSQRRWRSQGAGDHLPARPEDALSACLRAAVFPRHARRRAGVRRRLDDHSTSGWPVCAAWRDSRILRSIWES